MTPVLSICVITMNRAEQLKEALESCLACDLPEQTEFVILDNASTDHTETVVKTTLDKSAYRYSYRKAPENLGVGPGRNFCFNEAKGAYVYCLDDDAVVDVESCPDFFKRAIAILDENPSIASLTTQIYDRAWQSNRREIGGKRLLDDVYACLMFCGGSHFLRKSFFKKSPYLSIRYGYEELPPSLDAFDCGMINAYCPSLCVIHCPKIDKWDYSKAENHPMLIRDCAIPYAIKKKMYPVLFRPVLWLVYSLRCRKHLRAVPDGKKQANEMVKGVLKNNAIEKKIAFFTVFRLWKQFGFSAI